MMDTMLLEFEMRYACEAYPQLGEAAEQVIKRGDYQNTSHAFVTRWRTYELSADGEKCNYGPWQETTDSKERTHDNQQ